VVCNAHADQRISSTLYWSPAAWRFFSALAPFALLFGGMALGMPWLALAFWPSVIVLAIAHFIVRRKVRLELGACERHRRLRNVLRGLSIAALIGAVVVFVNLSPSDGSIALLVLVVATIIVLAVLQSFAGVQAVSLTKLDSRYAWLRGTGKLFREALPESPGA
jgi:hypothetical protein